MTRRPTADRPLSIAKSAASRVLDELRIRDPREIQVDLIAAHYGLMVCYKPLAREEGRLVRAGKEGLIVVDDQWKGTEKERFIEAHELGHFFRHEGVDQFELCTDRDLNDWYSTSGFEHEANVFAAELLMPERFFRKRCDQINRPNLTNVRELATEFRTSLTSTAIRLIECTAEPCAIIHSTDFVIDWCFKTTDFRFRPTRGARLTNSTYAHDLFAGKPVRDAPQLIDGAGWPGGLEIDIQEHSIKLGRYNSVLTLLWHKYE